MMQQYDNMTIKKADLDTLTYEKVKSLILDGTLKPGEKIIQDDLAAKLGVSRTPLRNALTMLARDHLVEVHTRGSYVRQFTPDEIITIFEIRGLLEGLLCRYLAETVTGEDVRFMRDLFDDAMKLCQNGDMAPYQKADQAFHHFLAKKCSNTILNQAVDEFHLLSVTFLQGLIRPPEETYEEHMNIIRALENKDPVQAEACAKLHYTKTVDKLRASYL